MKLGGPTQRLREGKTGRLIARISPSMGWFKGNVIHRPV